jgi:hypothetical protein
MTALRAPSLRSCGISPRRAAWVMLLGALCLAAVLRLCIATRPGLWVDEIFSLAMATGHSLEHPAAYANPALGDYVETPQARPPAEWRRFMQHETPPAPASRVARAVSLSDTNPPLYYVLLSLWTQAVGVGDASLRLFSVAAAVACLPLLWAVGGRIGGPTAASVACLMFGFSPLAVYYSVEGRMYSLTWLLGLALAWSSVELHRRGTRPALLLAWVIAGAAGLLTHYFLVFVWCACVVWLLLTSGRTPRPAVVLATGLSFAIAVPWYLHIPESIAGWRVTGGWLDSPLSTRQIFIAPLHLTWSMVTPGGNWNPTRIRTWLVLLSFALAVCLALRKGVAQLFTPSSLLPWLWLGASVLGLITVDFLRGTQAALYPRYVLPGLPAAFLLAGLTLSRVRRRLALALLLVILAAWAGGVLGMFSGPPRPWQPFAEVAAHLDARTTRNDVIIVQAIPSGVLGFARYMRGDTPIASWVEQLGVRSVPADLERLAAGVCQVVLVRMPSAGKSTAEPWLRAHAQLLQEEQIRTVHVLYFRPDPPSLLPGQDCSHVSLPTASLVWLPR